MASPSAVDPDLLSANVPEDRRDRAFDATFRARLLAAIQDLEDQLPPIPSVFLLPFYTPETLPITEESMRIGSRVIELKRLYNACNFVSSLPPEILIEIFRHFYHIIFEEEGLYDRSYSTFKGSMNLTHHGRPYRWITITQVCKQWREVALEVSSLWNRITITSNRDCCMEMFRRANESPIHLILYPRPGHILMQALGAIQDCAPTMETLDVQITNREALSSMEHVFFIGPRLRKVFVIEHLPAEYPSLPFNLVRHPRIPFLHPDMQLSELWYDAPYITWCPEVVMPSLRSLKLYCRVPVHQPSGTYSIFEVFRCIKRLTNLVELHLVNILPIPPEADPNNPQQPATNGTADDALTFRRVSLPSLKVLVLNGNPSACTLFLESFSFSSKVRMEVDCNLERDHTLAPSILSSFAHHYPQFSEKHAPSDSTLAGLYIGSTTHGEPDTIQIEGFLSSTHPLNGGYVSGSILLEGGADFLITLKLPESREDDGTPRDVIVQYTIASAVFDTFRHALPYTKGITVSFKDSAVPTSMWKKMAETAPILGHLVVYDECSNLPTILAIDPADDAKKSQPPPESDSTPLKAGVDSPSTPSGSVARKDASSASGDSAVGEPASTTGEASTTTPSKSKLSSTPSTGKVASPSTVDSNPKAAEGSAASPSSDPSPSSTEPTKPGSKSVYWPHLQMLRLDTVNFQMAVGVEDAASGQTFCDRLVQGLDTRKERGYPIKIVELFNPKNITPSDVKKLKGAVDSLVCR